MKALVYRGPNRQRLEDRPEPDIRAPTDAIVKVTNATICGLNLRTMKGDMRPVTRGLVLGHEGTGIIERVGSGVCTLRAGDAVLISCMTACGTCARCRLGGGARCESGGWLLGNTIDGTCADYVRVPFADHSLFPVSGARGGAIGATWIDTFHDGLMRDVSHGPDERAELPDIVVGGSVGMAPLLAIMQYYRNVVRPSIRGES